MLEGEAKSMSTGHDSRNLLLTDLTGQEKIKAAVRGLIAAAREKREPLEHMLFVGYQGMGKGTFAQAVAEECGAAPKIPPPEALQDARRFFLCLSSMRPGELLLLERLDSLKRPVREIALGCIEGRAVETVVGKGQVAQTFKVRLPRITVIATAERLTRQLRDTYSRGFILELEPYAVEEIAQMLLGAAGPAGVRMDRAAAELLANSAHCLPGPAMSMFRRLCRLAQPNPANVITAATVQKYLPTIGQGDITG
jgi:holliday junction DNA helicase RuvB